MLRAARADQGTRLLVFDHLLINVIHLDVTSDVIQPAFVAVNRNKRRECLRILNSPNQAGPKGL